MNSDSSELADRATMKGNELYEDNDMSTIGGTV